MTSGALEELAINTLRILAVDMVEAAKSGHPGTPMGAAPLAYVLWQRFLKHNPLDPAWPDRDRFVLSCGHASALLYALLHLTGYSLPLDELKRFRQWGSLTPGHPECRLTPGVEATTGPLGQGFANAVGMALAEQRLARAFNRPGHQIIDHFTYTLASDGDMMEGVSSEAASLAGAWQLGKLICLYDSNGITIEGPTALAFRENVGARFEAYGWQVIGPVDSLDLAALTAALAQARSPGVRPTLIVCRTIIGYGSPNKAGTAAVHGEPLGPEEARLTRANLKWPFAEAFTIPPEVLAHFRQAVGRGRSVQEEWERRRAAYSEAYPREARQLDLDLSGELPAGWEDGLSHLFDAAGETLSTREASGRVINALGEKIHSLRGGAADLAPSTRTALKDPGANLHFGVREHAMGAISSGLALHGGLIPYTATFLIFYDYMRPPVRLAALSGIRVIYIFTHDSVGLGEDGPTHQPVEQLMGLRMVPNLITIRPADAAETLEAWKVALQRREGPTALVLTRQALPVLDRRALASAGGLLRGGYILSEPQSRPALLLIASGSEVSLALQAGRDLEKRGIPARVVSLPSWELFANQTPEYRATVLPPDLRARISIEAGTTLGWGRYVGTDGLSIGVDRFGASAPGQIVLAKLGFNVDNIVENAMMLLDRR